MPGVFGLLDMLQQKPPVDLANLTARMEERLKHNEKWFDGLYFQHKFGFYGIVDFRDRLENDYYKDDKNDVEVLIFGDIFSIKDREIKGECKAKTVIDIYKMGNLNNLKELNGTFVLMIRDGKRFILINDQLGSLPLYYVPRKHQILFSSEIKAILEDPSISSLLNLESVVELLTFSYPLGNKSLLKGINLLPPSHMLICDYERGGFELRKYWDFKFEEETAPKCLEDYIREFDFKFEKAIRRRILEKDRIGIFLSGGVDSRLLACYAKKVADRMGKTLLSFTFGPRNCLQKKIAKEVADKLGIENIFLELSSNWIENMANEIIYKGDGHLRIRDAHFRVMFT
jgi:asparagine synthase (glutamine-hydrolysing)